MDNIAKFKSYGVDEICCIAVNDAFVMHAWGQSLHCKNKIRMIGDGSAEWTRAVGSDVDATSKGMGIRSLRYSMFIKNEIILAVFIDVHEMSSAATMLHFLSNLNNNS